MICKKCGNMYNENESMCCPKCGEPADYRGKQYENEDNNQAIGQSIMSNNGMYEQSDMPNNGMNGHTAMPNMGMNGYPAMMLQGLQYQQYAGKYYPGLSKKELFGLFWLRKYNTAIMVLSILMYIFHALIMFSTIYVLTEEISYKNKYYGSSYHRNDYTLITIWSISLAVIVVLLILSIIAHVKKSRVASGFVMGLYILCLVGQFIQMYYMWNLLALMLTLILLGLSVAIFILDIVYNSKWKSYCYTGIIPV